MSVTSENGSGGSAPRPGSRTVGRIELLDVLRGGALIAMAVYHFAWDLEFFGYVERGMTGAGGWKLFARSIATSFLLLVGIGLFLAHGRGIRWTAFWRRFVQVAAGAAIITATTWYATPSGYVFFGILHQIALASLLGLAFLRLPWPVTASAALVVIALPQLFQTSLTDPKPLAWIGMAEKAPVSNDYVPLFPWFGAVLLGVAAARLASDRNWWDKARALNPRLSRLRPLAWLGRRSLLFYLVHQPVLIGLVWSFAQFWPPDPSAVLESDCRRGCLATQADGAYCRTYCACISARLEETNLLKALVEERTTVDEDAAIRDMVLECSIPRP